MAQGSDRMWLAPCGLRIPRRLEDGTCALCGVWTCQHLLLGDAEDRERGSERGSESDQQLGPWMVSGSVGPSPLRPAGFETSLHAVSDDDALQGR
eukprot:2958253-Alexandrium_andersonii.AAC.1